MTGLNRSISFAMNLIIVILTISLVVMFFREDGKWNIKRGKIALRFFTTQSNVLCAVAALCICLFPDTEWTYYLKVIGTAAVSVTMLTVFLFLRKIYGLKSLLKGSDLFMHLITPLLAIVSLCVFERRGIAFPAAFIGVLPVALYAPIYMYNVIYAPEEKRWEDFYGFNKDGKWPVAYAMMHVGSALICVVLYGVLNLPSWF